MHMLKFGAAVFLFAALAAPAFATPVNVLGSYTDNFESSSPTAANTPPPGWSTLPFGTVDYLNNFAGITCHSAVGCVDMDGSSNAAGTMFSSPGVTLVAGQTYQLSAWISGNQRNTDKENVYFGVLNPSNVAVANGLALNLTSGAGLVNFTQYFTNTFVAATSGPYSLFFQGTGGDNIGAILDDVRLTAVPLPASAWMLLTGLIGLGLVSRRESTRI